MTKQQIVEYEATSTSWFMSEFYRVFPRLFIRKCEKKYKRYQQFKAMYDKTGEYLTKHFTK